jgi:hypothetical protein
MTHMDANAREYAGAIAGMAETYGRKHDVAVGDFVSGLTAERRWSGHVQVIEGDRMVVDVDGAWLSVNVKDITH